MALIDDVRDICVELAPNGWESLLKAHGLDITRNDLESALNAPLSINRGVPRDCSLEQRGSLRTKAKKETVPILRSWQEPSC